MRGSYPDPLFLLDSNRTTSLLMSHSVLVRTVGHIHGLFTHIPIYYICYMPLNACALTDAGENLDQDIEWLRQVQSACAIVDIAPPLVIFVLYV